MPEVPGLASQPGRLQGLACREEAFETGRRVAGFQWAGCTGKS